MKLWLVAFAAIGVLAATIFWDNKSTPPPPTHQVSAQIKKAFRPESVVSVEWIDHDRKFTLDRKNNQSWAIERRLRLLSELPTTPQSNPGPFYGKVTINLNNETIQGEYNDTSFVWNSGGLKGQEILLNQNEILKNILGEGALGFQPHDLHLCNPKDLNRIKFETWSMEKRSEKWMVVENKTATPADAKAVENIKNTLCILNVDFFSATPTPGNVKNILELNTGFKLSHNGEIFYSNRTPGFQSQILSELFRSLRPESIKDPTLEDAKVALDPSKKQEDRLEAIRRMKTSHSPQALAALRALIFEKTEIDLYRYEAVDSLAAIGSKDAYKIMTERLTQIGRSGFELRLARALSAAMGRLFESDEKTPEETRRPEVKDLIQAAKKTPPGK